MSDFYNELNKQKEQTGINPPENIQKPAEQVAPPEPPMAPMVNQPQTPQVPTVVEQDDAEQVLEQLKKAEEIPEDTQTTTAPAQTQVPPTNTNAYNPFTQQTPNGQRVTPPAPPMPHPPAPPKNKMSGKHKTIIIIVISVLVAILIGYGMHLGSKNSSKGFVSEKSQDPTQDYDYGDDYGYGFDFGIEEETEAEKYSQSDARDSIDKDYEGVKLESKPKNKNSDKYGASYTFNKLQDAVVGVVCYYEADENTDSYQSQGTGIIISENGYIVTNSHVIGNSRTSYLVKIITADKKEYQAGIVGYDSRSDIAVLKVDAENLPCAEFGDSKLVEVTEDVIAIGNPNGLDFQNSVTKGIVSALNRKVSTSNNVGFLQIDAAINPGNSGGPLCNMYGQVIGITTSKIASEYYEGMGFAIPSATMKTIVDDIIRNGYVTNRVKIGITGTVVYESTKGVDGIQIAAITQGGPMDNGEVKVNDIITAVDGENITTFAEVYDILEKHKEGDKVEITLYRPSTKNTFDVTITLQIDKAEE